MNTVFCACARTARAHTESLEMHCFQLTLKLPYSSTAVFDCLRDLSCLMHWWPHAHSIHALPPGLHGVGDMAVLRVGGRDVLLRVLVFKPGKRMVLALDLPQSLVLLDLMVQQRANQCEVRFRLESPNSAQPFRGLREWLWLRVLGARAAAALEQHLLQSDRVLAP